MITVGDIVLRGDEVLQVVGRHPTVPRLLIVENHDCKPEYVRETAVINTR